VATPALFHLIGARPPDASCPPPADEALRKHIRAAITRLADWMRNRVEDPSPD
jgi:hypothetical protein